MDEDSSFKKIAGFIVAIVLIAVLLPVFLRVNEKLNNEIITVYLPREVDNNNITLAGNFSNIDFKENTQLTTDIDEFYNLHNKVLIVLLYNSLPHQIQLF